MDVDLARDRDAEAWVAWALQDVDAGSEDISTLAAADFGLSAGVGLRGRHLAALSLYRAEFDDFVS